ncbi:MAG TPA: polyprenyl synthetase family protein [Dehalococcoidia bacterium]|nr:polyprenyl synthetase family protein [Dehalococcoidia bacterium]
MTLREETSALAAVLETTSSWDDYLNTYQQLASETLTDLLAQWKKDIFESAPIPESVFEEVYSYATGGKKSRGALVLLGYQLAGGGSPSRILRSSVSYELIHAAFLIHDDVMDRSLTRRHAPTAHLAFERLAEQIGHRDPEQFGVSMAINAGDIAPAIAYNTVCGEDLPPGRIIDGMICLNEIIIATVMGQFLDVTLSIEDAPDEDDVLLIHRLKTANYTVTGALRFGASLAGARKTTEGRALMDALADFGDPVGIAFQIQDDHLGMFASEDDLGKDVSSDLQERKNTLLFLHCLREGTDEQRETLLAALGHKAEGDDLARVQAALHESGAAAYSEQRAQQLVSQGKEAIPEVTRDERLAALLKQLADFVVSRGF